MEYISENWEFILAGIAVLVSLLNSVTVHFSEHKGLVKWAKFVIEILSFATSAKTVVGIGPFDKFKLPGQSVPPADIFEGVSDVPKE